MRTRLLTKLLNDEIEEYLSRNDLIYIPMGAVEMHGGFPTECEYVISEAVAAQMAERTDGLVLPDMKYFYAGSTTTGRGTTEVSVRQGIDYLFAIAESLYRQGFRRQVYLSAHGPSWMTVGPVIRDFEDRYGIPIVYIDLIRFLKNTEGPDTFHYVTIGAYDLQGRLDEIPITTKYEHRIPISVAPYTAPMAGLAYQSGAVGHYCGEKTDHMSTVAIPDEEHRQQYAELGRKAIGEMIDAIDPEKVVAGIAPLEGFIRKCEERYPWEPSAFYKRER